MSQAPSVANPFQIKMSGDSLQKLYEESKALPSLTFQKLSFPQTRAVLWNRKPIGEVLELNVSSCPSDVKVSINKRTLQLAQKQLHVLGKNFHGFCVGELQIDDDKISIMINRFDPGRDGQITTQSGTEKIRIPTTTVPGDFSIPIALCEGMAFVDHETSQTHNEEEFLKTMKVLESWCSRKDALNLNNLFSLKIKCCFLAKEDEILTYITCGLVSLKEKFSLVPVNEIPIIPTTLARNLEGAAPLSEFQERVKTGYITMDQTRKLLLLLETDPKVTDLPLVGVWVSGVEDVHSAEVWACCTRFLHNRSILERVYAPPESYLLITYTKTAASAAFYEFSRKDNISSGAAFQFLTCCEGLAMSNDSDMGSCEEEYVFDLIETNDGALSDRFNRVHKEYIGSSGTTVGPAASTGTEPPAPKTNTHFSSAVNHDDSMPLDCPVLSPLPQMEMQVHQSFPSVPDLSMCDSILIEPNRQPTTQDHGNILKEHNDNVPNPILKMNKILEPAVTKTMQANKKLLIKSPRPTKASLARMSVNKPVVKDTKKANLAISFENAANKKIETSKKSKEETKSKYAAHFSEKDVEEDSPLRLPVKIRVCNAPKISLSNNVADEDKADLKNGDSAEKLSNKENLYGRESFYSKEKSNSKENLYSKDIDNNDSNIKMDTSNLQPYCPDYYSDASADESFFSVSNKTCTINKESTVCEEDEDEENEVDEDILVVDEAICEKDEAIRSHESILANDKALKERVSPDIPFDASLNLSLDDESFVAVPEKRMEVSKNVKMKQKNEVTKNTEIAKNMEITKNMGITKNIEVKDIDDQKDSLNSNTKANSSPVKTGNDNFAKEVQLIKKMEKERVLSDLRKGDSSPDATTKGDADLDKKTKDALYELVLTQQEQLSKLQSQLQLFLQYQNIKQVNELPEELDKENKVIEETKKEKDEEEKQKKNKEEKTRSRGSSPQKEDREISTKHEMNSEVLSVQEKQQQQLNALQLQVQEFLSSAKSVDKKETSSQCSIGDRSKLLSPSVQSIAVNTGKSLLWPTVDMTTTHSDTNIRGYQQAEGIGAKTKEAKREVCQHCQCHNKGKKHSTKDESLDHHHHKDSPRKSSCSNSPSLSDIHAEDIASSMFEDTANSSYSMSSFKEIDMPTYEHTAHDVTTTPVRPKKKEIDWETSPMLGESASMLAEKRSKENSRERKSGSDKSDPEKGEAENDDPVSDREFYSQVMSQVQKLIDAQNISPSPSNDAKDAVTTSNKKNDGDKSSADVTRLSTNEKHECEPEEEVSPEECLKRVRDATMKQLNEIINQSNSSKSSGGDLSSDLPLIPRSSSSDAAVVNSVLPRINYMSLAVDETMCEESNFERIAAKYLPDEYVRNQMTEIRNKTVKFEGVYQVNAGKNMNMASVNFSCNMSIASKKYLQRYELGGETGDKLVKPLAEINGRATSHGGKQSIDTRIQESDSDKENILDFKKLRNLPKLL